MEQQNRVENRDRIGTWDWDRTYPCYTSSAETMCFVLVLDVLAGSRRGRIQSICKVCLCSARPGLLAHNTPQPNEGHTHLNGLLGLGRGGLSGLGLGLHLQTLFGWLIFRGETEKDIESKWVQQ